MLAAYGVDVLSPEVTPRRLHVLLERLPPSARRGGEMWSVEAELLAHLIDHVAQLTYVTLRAAGAKSVAKPTPVKRPAPRRRAPAPAPEQPAAVRSWGAAAEQLAAIPGVVVHGG